MKCITTINGSLSIALVPESELEIQALKQLFQAPVDTKVVEKVVIMDKTYQDAVIITSKTSENG